MSDSQRTWRIPEWFGDIDESRRIVLNDLHALITDANGRLDLVPTKTIPQSDLIHFANCILGVRAVTEADSFDQIHDLGSGSGFPGFIFAILNPGLQVSIVEPNSKKSDFFEGAVKELRLENVRIIRSTVEDLPENSLEVGCYRGSTNMSKALLVSRKLFAKGGRYFHFKGEEWAREVAQIPSQLCTFWRPSLVQSYNLPLGEVQFSVVKTEKIKD